MKPCNLYRESIVISIFLMKKRCWEFKWLAQDYTLRTPTKIQISGITWFCFWALRMGLSIQGPNSGGPLPGTQSPLLRTALLQHPHALLVSSSFIGQLLNSVIRNIYSFFDPGSWQKAFKSFGTARVIRGHFLYANETTGGREPLESCRMATGHQKDQAMIRSLEFSTAQQ